MPEAPNANPLQLPSAEDLPQPPVEAPSYSGAAYDLEEDSAYQARLQQAQAQYDSEIRQLDEQLESVRRGAEDAVRTAEDAANEQYEQNAAAAKEQFETDKENATSSVNPAVAKATYQAAIDQAENRFKLVWESNLDAYESTIQALLARYEPEQD